MSSQFDRIENRLQEFIESTLNRLPWRDTQPKLALPLVTALRYQLELDPQAAEPLPDRFNIFLHPDICTAWENHVDWQEWLARVIIELSGGLTRKFSREPEVRFVPDQAIDRKNLRVVLTFQEVDVSSTAVLPNEMDSAESTPVEMQTGPYLILEDNRTYPLKSPVTNIGRRETNDLVLSDIRISREHAQIRIIHNECMLFDLNSTGGTFVNGHRITTHRLQPGDVIVLAGANLIYGEETPQKPQTSGTSPANLTPRDDMTS